MSGHCPGCGAYCEEDDDRMCAKCGLKVAPKAKSEPVGQSTPPTGREKYGFCPQCGAKGVNRERRPNCNDRCVNGHEYPSADAVTHPFNPTPATAAETQGREGVKRWRKKPVVIEATRWWQNGDHPDDGPRDTEGKVVRYFRRPDVPADRLCQKCHEHMHIHGWIDTLEGGHIVCRGDWIITGVKGERYPCKPDIFLQTYEPESYTVPAQPAPSPALGEKVKELAELASQAGGMFIKKPGDLAHTAREVLALLEGRGT